MPSLTTDEAFPFILIPVLFLRCLGITLVTAFIGDLLFRTEVLTRFFHTCELLEEAGDQVGELVRVRLEHVFRLLLFLAAVRESSVPHLAFSACQVGGSYLHTPRAGAP